MNFIERVMRMLMHLNIGAALTVSWRSAGTVVQAFFVGNAVWMAATVGLLIAEAPQRLCNAYLEGDQQLAGHGLLLLGLSTGLIWLIAITRPWRTRSPDFHFPFQTTKESS